MADTVIFQPRHELDAKRNLAAFIEVARTQVKTIRPDLQFEDNIWTYEGTNRNHKIRFGTAASTKKGMPDTMLVPFDEPFLSFSKAYIRYQQGIEPVTTPETFRLLVLRTLHDSLIELIGVPDITALNPVVLNDTAARLKRYYAESSLASYGYSLKQIADFVQSNSLVFTPFTWQAPFKSDMGGKRVGEEFQQRRNERLPSPTALAALAHVFCNGVSSEDVMFSAIGALLCCGPSRISEVVALEALPGYSEKASDGLDKFGLRWRPAKGGKAQVKWIPGPMQDVAKEALRRIHELTVKGRKLALWYEKNPTQVFLPPSLKHLRNKPFISREELAQILYGDDIDIDFHRKNGAKQWFEVSGKKTASDAKTYSDVGHELYSFAAIEEKVLHMLPSSFPYIDKKRGIRYSEALLVTEMGAVQSDYVKYACMFAPVTRAAVIARFGSTPSCSMFVRHGLNEDDGTPIHLKTHQPRHYLNMVAQTNHMSQLDIALWSGRRLISQNRNYDHISGRDLALRTEEIVADGSPVVAPAILATPHFLVTRSHFAQPTGVAGHTTEFGHCVHDYSMLPCTLYRDCLNCDEHLCVKGDSVREAALRRHLDETRDLLRSAREAEGEGDYGADIWVSHQSKTVARMEELISILDNPQVPVGAVIRSRRLPGASRIEQATGRRELAVEGARVSRVIPIERAAAPRLAASTITQEEEHAYDSTTR